ncbi:uncharacterized protein LOC132643842 [Lycium barbarum]|uniref:uncharacterized protein LOC132643842 n=1 Tax=Lycium barbarum TaxID=112863 RepID=UPI00293E3BED|nr:uncharacterized protein LOC132643842 [Lycium barbarum]
MECRQCPQGTHPRQWVFRVSLRQRRRQGIDTPKWPYTYNSRPMVLKKWTPDFKIGKESMRVIPLWVTFPGLTVQCWAEENLGRIASCIGTPLCTDKLTAQYEKISHARVLIEMDITQTLPDVVNIETPEEGIWEQEIDYDWKPRFCKNCNHFSHLTDECQTHKEAEHQQKKVRKGRVRKEWQASKNAGATSTSHTIMTRNLGKQSIVPYENTDIGEHRKLVYMNKNGKQVQVYKEPDQLDPAILVQKNQFAVLKINEGGRQNASTQLVDKGDNSSQNHPT